MCGGVCVEECVGLEEKSLFEYVKASKEWMLKEVVEMEWVLKEQVESIGRERREREGKDWMSRCSMGSFFAR